jgi:hypothetical protein
MLSARGDVIDSSMFVSAMAETFSADFSIVSSTLILTAASHTEVAIVDVDERSDSFAAVDGGESAGGDGKAAFTAASFSDSRALLLKTPLSDPLDTGKGPAGCSIEVATSRNDTSDLNLELWRTNLPRLQGVDGAEASVSESGANLRFLGEI